MATLRRWSLTQIGVVVVLLTACSTPSDDEEPPVPDTPSSTVPAPSAPPVRLSKAEQRDLNVRLVQASWSNDVRRARRLIQRGADVNWRDETRQSAFLIAASEGHLRLLDLTLNAGADVTLHDRFNGSALIRATERGHWDVAGRLLQTSIDVDHVNNLGWTALLESVILGGSSDHATTVRVLVAGGANLTIRSVRDDASAVHLARARGQSAVVATLSSALKNARVQRPNQMLLRSARQGDADRAAMAIRAGARLESRDDRQRTPLLLAVTHDHLDVARVLLALGATPDAVDDQHDTPWLVTGVTGSVPMAELLLRFTPDLTLLNRFGGTSIIPASERGHLGYVRRVAQTDIDLDHVNDLGWTAMLEAVILGDGSRRYQGIVRELIAAGADTTIGDSSGRTPLQHARSRGHTAMARLLEVAS